MYLIIVSNSDRHVGKTHIVVTLALDGDMFSDTLYGQSAFGNRISNPLVVSYDDCLRNEFLGHIYAVAPQQKVEL